MISVRKVFLEIQAGHKMLVKNTGEGEDKGRKPDFSVSADPVRLNEK